jgi:hypothetical protein
MPSHDPKTPVTLRGKALAFNISPKGQTEGVLVDTRRGVVQVNFPKLHAESLARSMKLGTTLELAAELETDEYDHPVYRASDRGQQGKASGAIVRLNYALHGEVNGVHLEDGTFVHLKPKGALKHRLQVGERVKAVGTQRTGSDAVVLEATAIVRLGKRAAALARG